MGLLAVGDCYMSELAAPSHGAGMRTVFYTLEVHDLRNAFVIITAEHIPRFSCRLLTEKASAYHSQSVSYTTAVSPGLHC